MLDKTQYYRKKKSQKLYGNCLFLYGFYMELSRSNQFYVGIAIALGCSAKNLSNKKKVWMHVVVRIVIWDTHWPLHFFAEKADQVKTLKMTMMMVIVSLKRG